MLLLEPASDLVVVTINTDISLTCTASIAGGMLNMSDGEGCINGNTNLKNDRNWVLRICSKTQGLMAGNSCNHVVKDVGRVMHDPLSLVPMPSVGKEKKNAW